MTQVPDDNPISDDIDIAPGVAVPQRVLSFTFARSGGPGGQNVNKLNTKAQLAVQLEDLVDYIGGPSVGRLRTLAGSRVTDDDRLLIESESERSQRRNREECIARLRELIVRARVAPKRRRKTKPSRGSKERRLKAKKERGEIKRLRQDPRK